MKVIDIGSKSPKVLLWGDVGSGKTAYALTLGKRAQVIDLDEGLLTGVTLVDKFQPDRQAVDVKQFLEPAPHRQATVFAKVKAYVSEVAAACQSKKFEYDALIVDSLSALAEAALNFIMMNSGKLNQQPEIQHWGLAFSEIKNVIAVLRSLPVPVVLIAHEQVKSFGSGVNKEEKLELAVSGKNLASQISRYFDEIWYMRVQPQGAGKNRYALQTISDGKIPCRSRCNLPNYFDTSIGMWETFKRLGYTPSPRSSSQPGLVAQV